MHNKKFFDKDRAIVAYLTWWKLASQKGSEDLRVGFSGFIDPLTPADARRLSKWLLSAATIADKQNKIAMKKKKLEERLARALYAQQGLYPHPEWKKEEEYCRKALAKLEDKK